MIRKIVLVIILLNIIVSCGKKSDPEYKVDKYKYLNKKI